MADAKSEVVTKTVFHLTLDPEEAVVLVAILSNVGGPPEGPRGVSNRILAALTESDVTGALERQQRHTLGSLDGTLYLTGPKKK